MTGLGPRHSEGALSRMSQAISHRGPDASGTILTENVGMGHRRLAILDLSERGEQPMSTLDGRLTITYNGEIYNYRALRAQLIDRGWIFRSATDSEVVLYAWAEWGEGCLSRIDGMFAFGVYDRLKDSLTLVRDRLGIKPLYYTILPGGGLLFASEVRALLASGLIRPRINRSAVPGFLAYQTVLAPGHVDQGRLDAAARIQT